MPQAIVIKTNGQIESTNMESLTDMQEAVGGYIESIGIDESKYGVSVYCNEEGRIHELPINMACCMWLLQNGMYPALEYPIHGDVVVTGKCDDEGNDTDVPEDLEIPSLWKEPSFEILTGDEAKEYMGF